MATPHTMSGQEPHTNLPVSTPWLGATYKSASQYTMANFVRGSTGKFRRTEPTATRDPFVSFVPPVPVAPSAPADWTSVVGKPEIIMMVLLGGLALATLAWGAPNFNDPHAPRHWREPATPAKPNIPRW